VNGLIAFTEPILVAALIYCVVRGSWDVGVRFWRRGRGQR
jgi:hypothetical protein